MKFHRLVPAAVWWCALLAADPAGKGRTAKDLERPSAPPGITIAPELSEADAAAIASWNNNQLHAGLATLGFAEADVLDASLLRNFNLQALLPVAGKPFERLLQAPLEAAVQRPGRLELARASLKQTSQAQVQLGLDAQCASAVGGSRTRRTTGSRHEACGRVGKADRRTDRAEASRGRHQRVRSFDTNLPRVGLRSLEEQHARMAADVEIARERFRMALGLRGSKERFQAAGAAPADPVAPDSLDPLLERAARSPRGGVRSRGWR